jgi:hypothetical protein
MYGRIPARLARLAAALLAATALLALAAGAASASEVIYKNIPSPRPKAGLPALGFESDSVSEFGGEVQFGGTARTSPTIVVDLESYACQSGSGATCTTAKGASFEWPITLNVYRVGSLSSPIARITKTVKIPYRPSARAKCPLEMPEDVKGYGMECAFAKAAKASFALPGATLPAAAVIAVAYNTETYGSEPTGEAGPYDSLNVAINADYVCAPGHENPVTKECEGEDYERVAVAPPSVGSDPLPEQVFLNTTYSPIDCGGTLGSFTATGIQTEPECNWKYEQPAFEVKAK